MERNILDEKSTRGNKHTWKIRKFLVKKAISLWYIGGSVEVCLIIVFENNFKK